MTYQAKVLADSIARTTDVRLTTLEVTFPRFLLSEFNTHRALSRNSASSRAIPVERQIERVLEHPFVPVLRKRVKGMGVGELLEGDEKEHGRRTWMRARDEAVQAAQALVALDVDKSRANRLLEPFMWHTAIISATEWDNFFNLRCPPDLVINPEFPAQIEFQEAAIKMAEAILDSEPNTLRRGEWHLPLVDPDEIDYTADVDWRYVSAGRCARVSYERHREQETAAGSAERGRRLADAGHLSPLEHPATPAPNAVCGNFSMWMQLRATVPSEHNFGGVRWQDR